MSVKPIRHVPHTPHSTPPASTNVVWHQATVTRAHREAQNGHRSVIVWFAGLSGSGKSTLAHAVEDRLHLHGCRSFVLDGDNVRHGLCVIWGSQSKTAKKTFGASAKWPSCSWKRA